ncbi:MAG: hypothetical protein L0Z50_30060 [Verrucomicrobiales bacterium]|nr:hypothetical protein [Verrucomicrobiales bacterium]
MALVAGYRRRLGFLPKGGADSKVGCAAALISVQVKVDQYSVNPGLVSQPNGLFHMSHRHQLDLPWQRSANRLLKARVVREE